MVVEVIVATAVRMRSIHRRSGHDADNITNGASVLLLSLQRNTKRHHLPLILPTQLLFPSQDIRSHDPA